MDGGLGVGRGDRRGCPLSPRSLTLPFATAGVSRGGPGRAPLPFQVIKSPAAGQILAAKHTPRARGFSAGHRGCRQPPPVMRSPRPGLGTHRRGVMSSALALHACRGDPMAAPAPAQNRRQRYPDLCHPSGGPEPQRLRVAAPKQPCLGPGDAAHPQTPLTALPGGSGTSGVPKLSPTSAGGGTSRLQGLSKGSPCLWVMPP